MAVRRSICYDREALEARKQEKPADTALGMAAAVGIEILTEKQYRSLQDLGEFDTKTSNWIATHPAVRKLGDPLRRPPLRHGRRLSQRAQSCYAAQAYRDWLPV